MSKKESSNSQKVSLEGLASSMALAPFGEMREQRAAELKALSDTELVEAAIAAGVSLSPETREKIIQAIHFREIAPFIKTQTQV